MFINDDLAKFSSLNIFLSMIIYLLLLKPFMFSLYEMLQSILPDEETKEDFLRARQTVAIIFFPPILMWLLLEDMGLSEGMELMSEIKTLTIAPLFLFTLYILSPKLFNWAWRIKEATLFGVSIIGGSIGTLLGMYMFRHKTKHIYFVIGMPLILVIHVAAVLALLFFSPFNFSFM